MREEDNRADRVVVLLGLSLLLAACGPDRANVPDAPADAGRPLAAGTAKPGDGARPCWQLAQERRYLARQYGAGSRASIDHAAHARWRHLGRLMRIEGCGS